ncbi:MAG: DPP IV N-terminal domain-containing protein, partial [Caulobacterales bacterium]|nr:DPP IV N-terminal domain-containing protein [Caulobacterales bacterium]
MKRTVAGWICAAVLAGAPLAAAQDEPEADDRLFRSEDVFGLERASDPQISPDGRHVAYVRRSNDIMTDTTRSTLWIVDADGGDHRPLLADTGSYSSPRWSPDGERLAYLAQTEREREGLWVLWLDTGQTALVGEFEEGPEALSWSPDGAWIAFTMDVPADVSPLAEPPKKPEGASWSEPVELIERARYRSDGAGFLDPAYSHVFVIPALGGTERQITSGDFNHHGPLSWTPDGAEIVFTANRHEDWEYQTVEGDLFAVAVADGALTQLTDDPGEEFGARLSPDGRLIAFIAAPNVPEPVFIEELYVLDRAGGDRRALTADLDRSVSNLRWAGDGRSIYLQYDDRGRRRVARVPLAGGAPASVAEDVGGVTVGRPYISGTYTVSDNGRVAFTRGGPDRPGDVWVTSGRGDPERLTALNEDLLAHKTLGEVREIIYRSSLDDLEIQGWYITPPDYDPSRAYPLILEIHGGPHLAYGPHFSAELQRMAAEGYVVFYNNYRGSESYGRDFGMLLKYKYSSPDDFADNMSGIDALIAEGVADP